MLTLDTDRLKNIVSEKKVKCVLVYVVCICVGGGAVEEGLCADRVGQRCCTSDRPCLAGVVCGHWTE